MYIHHLSKNYSIVTQRTQFMLTRVDIVYAKIHLIYCIRKYFSLIQ